MGWRKKKRKQRKWRGGTGGDGGSVLAAAVSVHMAN